MKLRYLLYALLFVVGIAGLALVPAPAVMAYAAPSMDCEEHMSGPFVEATCGNYDEAAIWQNGQNQEGHDCLSPNWVGGAWTVLCLD